METRTNIVLDDALVNQVMARAGVKTKKAAIEAALKAYIRQPDYSAIMALRGAGVLGGVLGGACRPASPTVAWQRISSPFAPTGLGCIWRRSWA